MRVNDYRASQIAQTYGVQPSGAANAKAKNAASRADGASLSPAAQELLRARRATQEAPDVRAALVAELRQQVQSGTYQVDEHALAKRLLPFLDVEA